MNDQARAETDGMKYALIIKIVDRHDQTARIPGDACSEYPFPCRGGKVVDEIRALHDDEISTVLLGDDAVVYVIHCHGAKRTCLLLSIEVTDSGETGRHDGAKQQRLSPSR